MNTIIENKPFCLVMGIVLFAVAASVTILGGNWLGCWQYSAWVPFGCLLVVAGVGGLLTALVFMLSAFWRPGEVKPARLADAIASKLEALTPEQLAVFQAALDGKTGGQTPESAQTVQDAKRKAETAT